VYKRAKRGIRVIYTPWRHATTNRACTRALRATDFGHRAWSTSNEFVRKRALQHVSEPKTARVRETSRLMARRQRNFFHRVEISPDRGPRSEHRARRDPFVGDGTTARTAPT